MTGMEDRMFYPLERTKTVAIESKLFRRPNSMLTGFAVVLIVLSTSCGSTARKRGKDAQVSEAPLPSSIDDEILPYYKKGRFGEFAGVDGVPIRYVVFENPQSKGALVIVNGRTESYVKYAEVAYDLRDSGFSLYMIDHRGQGFSGRMLDDPMKGHVGRFRDYVTDLDSLLQKEVTPKHDLVIGLAHSMGGAILALYILDHQGIFDGAIFNAPMWQINLGHLNLFDIVTIDEKIVVRALSRKDPQAYAAEGPTNWFARPFSPKNPFTGSRYRYEMVQRLMFREFGDVNIGGPTNKWLVEAIPATREVRRRAAELELPMLVFQATLDEIVVGHAEKQVCKEAANCDLFPVEERHEALLGAPEPRAKVMGEIHAFLRRYQ